VRGLVLAIVVVVAYLGAVRGEFLWDDDLHVTANPTIIGPLGLQEIWTTAAANYFPLVLTNFGCSTRFGALSRWATICVTLACHALSAVLLWRVLAQLRVRGAWLGAALWALHPVQVESVAWICELKNTQSAVFFLAAILSWLGWRDSGRSRDYALALLCALLAILSKPSTVTLPVVLALCVWWQSRRLVWRDFVPLAPFFALSLLAAGWTIWEQRFHSGAEGAAWSQTWPERFAIAGHVVWFYLGKLLWPADLIFIYPRWHIDGSHLPFTFRWPHSWRCSACSGGGVRARSGRSLRRRSSLVRSFCPSWDFSISTSFAIPSSATIFNTSPAWARSLCSRRVCIARR